jgi:hypothetical protein
MVLWHIKTFVVVTVGTPRTETSSFAFSVSATALACDLCLF